jgi:hypothetical protein
MAAGTLGDAVARQRLEALPPADDDFADFEELFAR